MKTTYRQHYCKYNDIEIKDLATPQPNDDQILVKAMATSINRTDTSMVTGSPLAFRLFIGLLKPKNPVLGTDFAGEVKEVGKSVTSFKKGDRIMSFDDEGMGSQAQFIAVKPGKKAISKIPAGVDYYKAVASMEGIFYAWNFISKSGIKEGDSVFVNGATGNIGSTAIQLLHDMNCKVWATCRAKHFERVRQLGVENLIDYTKEDFTDLDRKFDFVFDAVGKSRFKYCRSILKANGVYVSSELGPNAENLFLSLKSLIWGKQKVKFPFPSGLESCIKRSRNLLEKGTLKPLIDKAVSFDELPKAYEYVASGQKVGNLIFDPWK